MKTYKTINYLLIIGIAFSFTFQAYADSGKGRGNSRNNEQNRGKDKGNRVTRSESTGRTSGGRNSQQVKTRESFNNSQTGRHDQYKNLPKYRSSVSKTPSTATRILHGGVNYSYNDGIFYKPSKKGYVVVAPPVGARVRILPSNYKRIVIGPSVYFYYYGAYYRHDRRLNHYFVVAPPVGAIVDALPYGYHKVFIDGITYYVFEGTYYRAFIDNYGEVLYEVVG
ncbi:MAG TPA: DUF6515 family protein [Cytophagales bacterium]|nr:DUF6515 family protein [Cytophagales bacterium]